MNTMDNVAKATLETEIKLQINQRLLESGLISKEMYEAAITRIVSEHPNSSVG